MALRIAFAGGVPKALGGGGLELQMERTAAALRALGHTVERVESPAAEQGFDVLHAFRAEIALHEVLPHWRRNRAPLVLSPVLVVAEGRERRMLSAAARLPAPVTSARMRREVLAQAAAIVALTEHERGLLTSVFGAPEDRITVLGNGVDAVEPMAPAPGEAGDGPFLLLVGNVDARKRQAQVLEALGGAVRAVVAGGAPADFARLAERTGATWLGEVRDPARVRGLQRASTATALISTAEGLPLAVLESLAAGTPAIVSDIPVHRELATRYPGWVRIVHGPGGVRAAFEAIAAAPPAGPPPALPGWGDVAAELARVYERVLAVSASSSESRSPSAAQS